MDPDSMQIGMSANTALPAFTRNVMRDVVKLSDKIRYPYLWNFEGSILAFAGWVVLHVCLAYVRALAAEVGLNVYFSRLRHHRRVSFLFRCCIKFRNLC
jgi:hypothetical protein